MSVNEITLHTVACERASRLLFEGVDCRVRGGAMLQVRGANGVGKSSLLRIIAGLTAPEVGRVCWNGAPIARCRDRYLRTLTYCGHRFGLHDALTPEENLRAACALSGCDYQPDALARVGLRDCRRPCATLSAGQRQRVVLARLSMRIGGLWLLDEPAASLDIAARDWLTQLLRAHIDVGGMVIFVSHIALALDDVVCAVLDLDRQVTGK